MFDITWTNAALIFGAGFVLVGKKDLPMASRFCGRQVGRLVGLLQGARVRAARLADQQSSAELKELQNELRSGLRELDMVRAEMTHTFRRPGTPGSLMSTAASSSPQRINARALQDQQTAAATMAGVTSGAMEAMSDGTAGAANVSGDPSSGTVGVPPISPTVSSTLESTTTATSMPESSYHPTQHLAPSSHAMGAFVEDEWAKQGIDFKSRAEQGQGLIQQSPSSQPYDPSQSSSQMLSNAMQASLLMDQYDRAYHHAMEQDEQIQQRIKEREQQEKQQQNVPSAVPSSSDTSDKSR